MQENTTAHRSVTLVQIPRGEIIEVARLSSTAHVSFVNTLLVYLDGEPGTSPHNGLSQPNIDSPLQLSYLVVKERPAILLCIIGPSSNDVFGHVLQPQGQALSIILREGVSDMLRYKIQLEERPKSWSETGYYNTQLLRIRIRVFGLRSQGFSICQKLHRRGFFSFYQASQWMTRDMFRS